MTPRTLSAVSLSRYALPSAAALLLLAAVSGALLQGQTGARPRVTLVSGTLEGVQGEGSAAVFKGVPFAQPPVGPLRWHEPVPVKPWIGVRDASAFGGTCAQNGRGGPSGSDDCLYLNVYTPEWPPQSPHPVMLWLYGGANATGSAGNNQFDGTALGRRGMVVVTANYRVGVMGFMGHPQLSAESPHHASGNYGLLDELSALHWVKENIAKFGGDPNHVTLFGQSSGAYDIQVLMTSPLAKGLFVNAITESGQLLSYNGTMVKGRAEQIGEKIAADLKAPGGQGAIEYLRRLPAAEVVAAGAKWLPTDLASDTGLLTSVDGYVLPELPARVFAAGRELPVPLIIGNNSREITPQISPEELRKQIVDRYGDLGPKALEAYGLDGAGAGKTDPSLGGAGAQWMTDIVQRCAAIQIARWHASAQHPTWEYQFERSIPGREEAGSTHGAEVAFVFGTLRRPGPNAAAFTDSDFRASELIGQYWTNFAKTGDPNGAGIMTWPRAGNGQYLSFTADGPAVNENLQAAACGVFREWTLRRIR
jgi:para-nitrobenzyl esterase